MILERKDALIDAIKECAHSNDEANAQIDYVSEKMIDVADLCGCVDCILLSGEKKESCDREWKEAFEKTKIAIIELNKMCESYKAEKVFPEVYPDGTKLYSLSIELCNEVSSTSPSIWLDENISGVYK